MNLDENIKRLEKFQSTTKKSVWLSSQMRLNLERAYATKIERKRILNVVADFFNFYNITNKHGSKINIQLGDRLIKKINDDVNCVEDVQ